MSTRNNNSTNVLLEFGKTAAVRPSDATDTFSQTDATVRGPIPALVLASYSINDKTTGKVQKQSNILVSGSSGMLDAYSIDNSSLSDSEYLLNVFDTLTDKKETIKIQSKTITGNELNISTAEANWLGADFCPADPACHHRSRSRDLALQEASIMTRQKTLIIVGVAILAILAVALVMLLKTPAEDTGTKGKEDVFYLLKHNFKEISATIRRKRKWGI